MNKFTIFLLLFLLCLSSVNASTITHYGSDFKIIGNEISYKINDRLGSDRLTLNNENVIAESNVLPYGQQLKNNNVKFSFTGKELDNTNNYYFNARYYDYDSGKFLGVDPVSDNHAYAYVSNNPMNYIDPSGLENILYIHANYETGDYNGAFKSETSKKYESKGHTVDEYVINDLAEFKEAFTLALEKFSATGEQYDFFIFGAHGQPRMMLLGDMYLFGSNIEDMGSEYQQMFKGGSEGILKSCSGAASREDGCSNAQAFANMLNLDIWSIDIEGSMNIDAETLIPKSCDPDDNRLVTFDPIEDIAEYTNVQKKYAYLNPPNTLVSYVYYKVNENEYLRIGYSFDEYLNLHLTPDIYVSSKNIVAKIRDVKDPSSVVFDPTKLLDNTANFQTHSYHLVKVSPETKDDN